MNDNDIDRIAERYYIEEPKANLRAFARAIIAVHDEELRKQEPVATVSIIDDDKLLSDIIDRELPTGTALYATPIPPAGHYKDALIEDLDDRVEPTPSQSRLTVRLCSFSESNGKRNWTAMFVRVDEWHGLVGNCGGITIEQGEYWNRVAYHAEQAKFLLGERDTEPFILDYAEDIQTPEEWKGEVHTSLRNKS